MVQPIKDDWNEGKRDIVYAITSATARHGQNSVRRGARGSITRLPSGSLRVRVYSGLGPVTRHRRYLIETIPDGPAALETT